MSDKPNWYDLCDMCRKKQYEHFRASPFPIIKRKNAEGEVRFAGVLQLCPTCRDVWDAKLKPKVRKVVLKAEKAFKAIIRRKVDALATERIDNV